MKLYLFPALMLLVPAATAQYYTFEGTGQSDRFGASVAPAGDIDGDGATDILVGEPRYLGGFCGEPFLSKVRLYSGRTGEQLLVITEDVDQHLGRVVAGVGDVNGDGVPDLAAATGGDFCCYMGFVGARVFSGATGGQLLAIPKDWYDLFGAAIFGPGDIDGDGRADLILGSPDDNQVAVHRGSDGSLIWSHTGSLRDTGKYVTSPGDWSGDGVPDVAFSTSQGIELRSGIDGQLLGSYPVTGTNALDPIDGDGAPPLELLVSRSGEAIILDSSLQVTGTLNGYSRARAASDFTGDGSEDLLVSDSMGVGLASIPDGYLVRLHTGAVTSMASLGDATDDSIGDVVIGREGGFQGGKAWVYNGYRSPEPMTYCSPAAVNSTGVPARIGYTGTWSIGNGNLSLTASDLPDSMPGIFYYGPNAIQTPFGNGFRCVGAGSLGTFRLGPPLTPVGGKVTRPLDFGSGPLGSGPGAVSPGVTFNFQFWYRDIPAGGAFFNLSEALQVFFIP